MIKVMSSHEELIEHIRDVREALDSIPVQSWQNAMTYGDCFVQLVGGELDIPCDIYGEIIKSEYEEDIAALAKTPKIRLCKCYSVLCPEGEYGNIHIGTMTLKLSRETFNTAKELGWPAMEAIDAAEKHA